MTKFKDYNKQMIADKLKQVQEFEAKHGECTRTIAWRKWCTDANYRKREWQFRTATVDLYKYNNRIL
jgi:hypothetical protein